jgi:hypothetical protein
VRVQLRQDVVQQKDGRIASSLAQEAGFNDHLVKPFGTKDLKHLLCRQHT